MQWLLAAVVAFVGFAAIMRARLNIVLVLAWWVIWVLLVGLLHSAW